MQKIPFEDLPSTNSPISAANLNLLQSNVENAIPSNANIVNLIYPVGSIYMSVNSTSPATLFGGTWERIKDKFMLSAGDTYSAGATGGSASHKLTSAELPKHTHTYAKPNANTNSHTLTTNEIPSHSHVMSQSTMNNIDNNYGFQSGGAYKDRAVAIYDTSSINTRATGGGQGHAHGIGTTSTASGDGGFANNSFSTLPPYLAVYVWKRTA